MLNLIHCLGDFSRQNCLAICAALVPLNLIGTSITLGFLWFRRSPWQIVLNASLAMLPALIMVLHVWSWFVVGVVRIPTFVLLGLAAVCLLINGAAIAFKLPRRSPQKLSHGLPQL